LKEQLKKWKSFIADELGLWGIARQCDPANINSPGNVFIVDEETKKMKLIDITPGVLGGQVYFLPLELKYFLKGLFGGNFLPFADAVDLKKLHRYCTGLTGRKDLSADPLREQRIIWLKEYVQLFTFFVNKWQASEPRLLSSPLRVLAFLFDTETIQETLQATATNCEYAGVIDAVTAKKIRATAERSANRLKLGALRAKLAISLLRHGLLIALKALLDAAVYLFLKFPVILAKRIVRLSAFIIKIYTDRTYRQRIVRNKFENWLGRATIDKRISPHKARSIWDELQNEDVLEILEVVPLWTLAKIIKPPFIGTSANLLSVYMLVAAKNPYWLLPLFADGVVRLIIAVLFTGLKYKPLLFLSLIPTFGFILPVPVQLMKDSPALSEFFMKEVVGTKLATSLPGVDRHSFRTYFYVRLMDIPLFFMRAFCKLF
jgi:hypothetical protein